MLVKQRSLYGIKLKKKTNTHPNLTLLPQRTSFLQNNWHPQLKINQPLISSFPQLLDTSPCWKTYGYICHKYIVIDIQNIIFSICKLEGLKISNEEISRLQAFSCHCKLEKSMCSFQIKQNESSIVLVSLVVFFQKKVNKGYASIQGQRLPDQIRNTYIKHRKM